MQVPHRGTRGGEKARKRQFFEVSDQVRSAQRNLFRTVPWRRIEYSESTPALSQAFTAIAANPNDPSEPGWVVVATFNAALLAHLPAQQAGAPGGAAHSAPEADDDQPDPDAAAHDDQVDIGQDAEEAAPPDQAEPELEVPPRAPTEEELITLDHQILDDHLDIHDTGAEGQVQVGAEGQVQPGAVLEGAASGAPGEPGAEEEEQPEQDEYVEVEIDTPEGSIYSPLAPEEVEEEPEEEAASSSAYPAPTGRGPLSSRVPLVLKPALGVYPTVRIDSTGIWIRYSGPLSQPEPLTGAAPSAPAAEEEDPLYFEGDPYELLCTRCAGGSTLGRWPYKAHRRRRVNEIHRCSRRCFPGLLPPLRQELLNLCLYHYPFLQNPKVMRSVLGGLAVRQAEPKVAEARQMQSEYVEAVGQELLQLTATPRLKLRPLGPEPLGRALGLLPLPVLPWPVAPYLAEPLQCVGAQLGVPARHGAYHPYLSQCEVVLQA